MATAAENARKVLNSIKAKFNLDKLPRGTFIESFGDDLAYIRYNGCITDRYCAGDLNTVDRRQTRTRSKSEIPSGSPRSSRLTSANTGRCMNANSAKTGAS